MARLTCPERVTALTTTCDKSLQYLYLSDTSQYSLHYFIQVFMIVFLPAEVLQVRPK